MDCGTCVEAKVFLHRGPTCPGRRRACACRLLESMVSQQAVKEGYMETYREAMFKDHWCAYLSVRCSGSIIDTRSGES